MSDRYKMNNGATKKQGKPKTNGVNNEGMMERKLKSKFWAYVFWLFGGVFGAHHLYLGRDDHAFVFFSTLGGNCGLGWIRDLWRIPTYVADANEQHEYMEWWKHQLRIHKKPPFSAARFLGTLSVAYLWAATFSLAIPEDEIAGINFRHLVILIPAVVTLGVWFVGNIGRERGSIWIPLACTYAVYPTYYYVSDEGTWLSLLIVVSALSFDTFSKQWRLQPRKKRSKIRRFATFALCALVYASAWGSYLYFNAMITDSDGEPIKLTDAAKHLFTSPIWLEFKASLWATWEQLKNQGFWETWKQLVELTDPRGEINAYRVLELSQTASQSEVTAKWRALSKEHHPDKVKGSEEERRAAQEKFMEIQQAYEILSSKKHRRQRNNRRAG